ncbi:MAG: carbohydrate kinase [Bacteroidales bacterium 36-12]|mgnify:CR=1 FL=1|nr:MAG: carbohydrate kinase [Bacteroidales bacterium 36-12]
MDEIIVGLGEILWDVFPEGKVLGGAPANFAYHVSQFGLNGYAISAIGKDDLGDEILQTLGNKTLNTHLEKVDFPTGTVKVTLSGKGIPQYEICEGVAWDNIPYTNEVEALAKRTKAVCFGSLAQRNDVSRNTINQFLDAVPENAMKIFDINLRQYFYSKELIDKSLKKCNVLKINDEEVVLVAGLYGLGDLSEIKTAQYLMQTYQLDMLVLTKGVDGSYVFTSNKTSFLPTPIVKVADTVGAGDSFTAGLVASLLKGESVHEAHKKAVEISAFVCTQQGAMPEVPDKIKGLV